MAKEVNTVETTETEAPKRKKQKVLEKVVTKENLIIKVLGTDFELTADPASLPENVQEMLPSIALSHILGDAAAGKTGEEAVENIQKKWDALVEGNLTVRKPAEKKIKVSDLLANLSQMGDDEAEKAKAALAALGISL